MSEPDDYDAMLARANANVDNIVTALADLHVRRAFADDLLKLAVTVRGCENLSRSHLMVLLGVACSRLADQAAHW